MLKWPHEVELASPSIEPYATEVVGELLSLLWLRSRVLFAREPRTSSLRAETSRRYFHLYNGDCPWVEGKLEFTRIVRKLGYLAPTSVEIRRGQPESRALLAEIEGIDAATGARLCKPRYDAWGRGLHIARSPEEAMAWACAQNRAYLVQNLVPPYGGQRRYIMHRTAADMAAECEPSIRMASTELGPTIVGDGTSTVKELIARQIWLRRNAVRLGIAAPDRVPGPGERVQLVNSGNIWWSNSHAIPDPQELRRVDPIMLAFLADFEQEIGGIIATVCLDIGYTHEGEPIFYEMQFPFGNHYGRLIGGSGRQPRGVRSKLKRSMLLGGQVARSI